MNEYLRNLSREELRLMAYGKLAAAGMLVLMFGVMVLIAPSDRALENQAAANATVAQAN